MHSGHLKRGGFFFGFDYRFHKQESQWSIIWVIIPINSQPGYYIAGTLNSLKDMSFPNYLNLALSVKKGRQKLSADMFLEICKDGLKVDPAVFFAEDVLEIKKKGA